MDVESFMLGLKFLGDLAYSFIYGGTYLFIEFFMDNDL
jgi:hypothetical protein